MANNYEIYLILDSKKEEAAAQKIIRDIEAVLNKYGAKILKTGEGQNQKLAYQINKRKETYQTTIEVEADPAQIAEIRRNLNLIESLARFNIFALSNAN